MAARKKLSLEEQQKVLQKRIGEVKKRITRDKMLLPKLVKENKLLTEKMHFKQYEKVNSILQERGINFSSVDAEKIADLIAEEKVKMMKGLEQ